MRRLTLLVAVLAAGCPSQSSGPDAATGGQEAAPAPPPPPPFDVTDDRVDVSSLAAVRGGEATALDLQAQPLRVPADAHLSLTTWQRLVDYRVRLVDPRDRLVPYQVESGPVAVRSAERPEPGGTWFRIQPEPPLAPGASYQLRLEGERADSLVDHLGRAYQDLVLELIVEAPAPAVPTAEPDAEPDAELTEPKIP